MVVGVGTLYRRVFLPNEPNLNLRMYFIMNWLGKIRVGFVLQIEAKKQEVTC